MRLDAIHHQNGIGVKRIAIHEDPETFRGGAKRYRLHRRADLGADEVACNSVPFEDFTLTFRARAPVASHSRKNERHSSQGSEPVACCAGNFEQTGDAAASHGDSDPPPAKFFGRNVECRKGVVNLQIKITQSWNGRACSL